MKFGIFLVFLLLGLFIANPLCAQTLNEIFTKEDTLVYMGYIQELFNLNDSRNLILQNQYFSKGNFEKRKLPHDL